MCLAASAKEMSGEHIGYLSFEGEKHSMSSHPRCRRLDLQSVIDGVKPPVVCRLQGVPPPIRVEGARRERQGETEGGAGCALTFLSDRPWCQLFSSISPSLLRLSSSVDSYPPARTTVGTDSATIAIGDPILRTNTSRGTRTFVTLRNDSHQSPLVSVYRSRAFIDQDHQCLPEVEFTPAPSPCHQGRSS